MKTMKKAAIRGLTLVELLIVLTMLGVLAALAGYGIFGFLGLGESASGIFDERAAARKWAEDLSYEVVAVNCNNAPRGLDVRCTVRVAERPEPFAILCNVGTKGCGMATQFAQP
jgi:prepilin-type N-terminal cleavage/methylation domain-containing protein